MLEIKSGKRQTREYFMSNGFQFLDIILFAMIAAFLILRLRSVLGRHKDSGKPQQNNERENFSADSAKNNITENIISLPNNKSDGDGSEKTKTPESDLDSGIHEIQAVANDFDPTEFLSGARTAFEMIVQAFADGNTETLERLLNDEVYNNFLHVIRERETENQTLENTLIRIVSGEIIDAGMTDGFANVTVKIISEQVNVTRDQAGDVVSGDPDHILEITDIWTFARNTSSQDPNWMLVATRSLD